MRYCSIVGPVFDPDVHFLVITKRAAQSLRILLGNSKAEIEQLRNLLIPILCNVRVVVEYDLERGHEFIVRGRLEAPPTADLEMAVCWAWDERKMYKTSPDGIKNVVFLVNLKYRLDSA